MKRIALVLLLGLVVWSGCKGCEEESVQDDDDATVIVGDDDLGDDDATWGTLPPLPTPTPLSDPLTTVSVMPSGAELSVGDTLLFAARGWLRSGEEVSVEVETWTSDAPDVASVDESGLVTALSVGTAQITATVEGVTSEPVLLEVTDGAVLTVQVVDADSGEPVPGAEVYLGVDEVTIFAAGEDGIAVIRAEDGSLEGRQTVTAYHPDYYHATLFDVVGRRVTVPLRSKASTDYGEFTGCVDFDEMGNLPKTKLRIGLVSRSFYGNPLSLDPNALIGDFRRVDICGYAMDLPANIVGEAVCADIPNFAVPGPPGDYGAYMLAGDLDLATLFGWLEEDPDIFYNLGLMMMLIPNMYEFSYDYAPEVTIDPDAPVPTPSPDGDPCATESFIMSPAGVTDYPLNVQVPALPSGVAAEYPPAVFAIADMGDQGFLPVGVNGANGGTTATVFHAAEFLERPLYAMILASEYGVGNDGAYVAVMGRKTSEEEPVKPPDFLDLIQPASFSIADRTYTFYPVAGVDVYRTVMYYRYRMPENTTVRQTLEWDLYQASDSTTTVLPSIPTSPETLLPDWELYHMDWEFFGYDTGDYSYDVLTTDESLTVWESTVVLERITRNKKYKVEEG